MKKIILFLVIASFFLVLPVVSAWNLDGTDYLCRRPYSSAFDVPLYIDGLWTNNGTEQRYEYFINLDCTGNITIGNVTPLRVFYENDTSPFEGNYDSSIYTADWCSHMNEDNATDSCNSVNGTGVDNPANVAGVFGNALDFDGTDDAVDSNYGAGLDPATNRSLCNRFNWDGDATVSDIWGSEEKDSGATNKWRILINWSNDGDFWLAFFRMASSTQNIVRIQMNGNISANTWYHLCIVTNGTTATDIHLYLNGTKMPLEVKTAGTLSIGDTLTQDIYIGALKLTSVASFFDGTIDEFGIWERTLTPTEVSGMSQNGSMTFGANETESNITITIERPENITYFTSDDFNFIFRATSFVNTTFAITAILDGSVIYSNNSYINNTNTSVLENVSVDSHNFTVNATDSAGTRASSVFFTVDNFEPQNIILVSPAFETSNQTYNLTQRINIDLVDNVTTNAYWNGSLIGAATITNNTTHIRASINFTIPLILTNNTNFTVIFENTVSLFNGTTFEANSTANQTVFFAYFISAFSTDSQEYLEGATITASTSVSDKVDVATLLVFVDTTTENINDTSSFVSGTDPKLYSSALIAPDQTASPSTVYTLQPYVQVSFNSSAFNRTFNSSNVTVFRMVITSNCTLGILALTLNMFEEINQTADNGSVEITIIAIAGDQNRSYNFSFTASTSHQICIFPHWGIFDVNATIQYSGTDFPIRFYFLTEAEISNSSSIIRLFMLNEDIGNLISPITVRDSVGNLVEDVILQFQRYYIGQNKYETVAMTISDVNGISATFLQMHTVWYRIVMVRHGEVIRTIRQSLVTETNPTYSTEPTELITTVDFLTGITFSCTDTDAFISCTVVDTTGIANEMCLNVSEIGIVSMIPFNGTCTFSSSATLVVNITSLSADNKTSRYILSVFDNEGNQYILETGTHDIIPINVFGLLGVILTGLLILPVSALGIKKPSLGILFGGTGVLIAVGLTILDMTVAAIGSLVIVIIILFYVTSER